MKIVEASTTQMKHNVLKKYVEREKVKLKNFEEFKPQSILFMVRYKEKLKNI